MSGDLTCSEHTQCFGIDHLHHEPHPVVDQVQARVRLGSDWREKKVVQVSLKHLLVPNGLYIWNVLDIFSASVYICTY